tara:strand:- start:740 stop:1576 length:837 start_codon:yes stop_codon:yes gene_type:complete
MQELKKRIWLERFDCLSISGKDANKFLNGITTGNIINATSKVTKTCWLTPKGILRSLLEIIFLENKLEVVILEGDIDEVINFFNKIIFPADDVCLSDPFSIIRIQEVDESNSWRIYKPIFLKNEDEEYYLYKKDPNVLNLDELQLWKIVQAIPSLDNEIDGKNNPLELGLRDLIDFNKGCYLGQETMSRIKNASSLKQEIRVWETSDFVLNFESENKNLYTDSTKKNCVGRITRFLKTDSKIKGLAIIKRKYIDQEKFLYSEIFGQIKIFKSVGSIFL